MKPIMVQVGEKEYETYLDAHEVQRFKENKVIEFLVDKEIINLNKLRMAFNDGKFPMIDYAEFMMMTGYSVCGFCDLSSFDEMEINNPLWEKHD